jgi:hypothetical protein
MAGPAASYQSGILFLVSVGQDFSWTLGFFHQNWKLTPGEAFALALTFDGQAAINVQGMPIGTTLVSVGMPANSALINQFRKAKVMTAFAQGQLLQFNLTQTAALAGQLRLQRQEKRDRQCRRVCAFEVGRKAGGRDRTGATGFRTVEA